MATEQQIRNLVIAAIKLAIIRHDLTNDDLSLTEDDADQIARDTWEALRGIGTCAAEPRTELTAVLHA